MGRRGPLPQSPEWHALRGGRLAKERAGDPVVEPGRPACPRTLTPEQRKVWTAVVKELDAIGVLVRVDGFALERYAVGIVRWRRLVTHIEENGETISTEQGERAAPETRIARALSQELQRFEMDFGMSPVARRRLHITEDTGAGDSKPTLKVRDRTA